MAVNVIGGGKRNTRRKPTTYQKSPANFMTYCCIEYILSWAGFEIPTLVVIVTDCMGSCRSNYHTITTTTAKLPFSFTYVFFCISMSDCALMINVKFVILQFHQNHIGCVMVSVLASSAVDRWFEPLSDQTKDYEIGICCFSAKHVALRRKIKDWLAWNQNNVSEWGDMSTRGLLFQ